MMIWFWWIVAIVALIVEIATIDNIICIWFTFGGIFAGILQLLGVDIAWQICGFTGSSLLSMFLLRPLAKTYLQGNIVPTNVDRFLGQIVVLEKECSRGVWGEVKVNEQIWSCVNIDDGLLACGSKVKIMAIDGAKFIVKEVKEKEE